MRAETSGNNPGSWRGASGLALSLLAATALIGMAPVRGTAQDTEEAPKVRLAYHDTWRQIWSEQVTWTRMVIQSELEGALGADAAKLRLGDTCVAMRENLRPFYHADAWMIADMLTNQVQITTELLKAAKAAQWDAFRASKIQWYANADAIAAKMHEINPDHWSANTAKSMWKGILDATAAEAKARFSGDYAADLAAYDNLHKLSLEMADYISSGIMRQSAWWFIWIGTDPQ
jgi:hypothetical protein